MLNSPAFPEVYHMAFPYTSANAEMGRMEDRRRLIGIIGPSSADLTYGVTGPIMAQFFGLAARRLRTYKRDGAGGPIPSPVVEVRRRTS
jgi:hypothetical protein